MPFGLLAAGAVKGGKALFKKLKKKVTKKAIAKAGAGLGIGGAAGVVASQNTSANLPLPPGGMMMGKGKGPGVHTNVRMGRGHGFGRRRRINPGNIRALRRSVRRVHSAAKMFSSVFSISHGHVHGKVKLKHHHRRRVA